MVELQAGTLIFIDLPSESLKSMSFDLLVITLMASYSCSEMTATPMNRYESRRRDVPPATPLATIDFPGSNSVLLHRESVVPRTVTSAGLRDAATGELASVPSYACTSVYVTAEKPMPDSVVKPIIFM